MEQKLSVIMASDVVGYSRLMGIDERGTLAALKKHRHELLDVKIAVHQGRIIKLIGDGMLAEFRTAEEAVAFASASKALDLNPNEADAHWALGVIHLWRGEAERAIGCYERGRELAPNNCDLLAEYCDALGYLGRLEDAIRIGELAVRLNPSRPDWYLWNIAASKYLSENYLDALSLLEKMAELGSAYRLLAATYAQLGRLEDARRVASELLKINPEFSIQRYSSRAPYRDKALLARYVDGLRLAGLPE